MPRRRSESSPLLASNKGLNRSKFVHDCIFLFLFFGVETLVMAIGGATIWSDSGPILWVVWFFVAIQSIFLLLCLQGYRLWSRGDLPVPTNKEEDCASGPSRFVTTSKGRKIEYFVWGSDQKDATVSVVLHGSNGTGKYFNLHCYPDKVMKDMNVKIISPSYPAHGGSDSQPHRRIKDWPKDDLEPILRKEGVDKFIVQGSSYGTAHAMATAAYFPKDRCVALGLNVPYLPEPICREFGFHTDADYVLDESRLSKPWILLPCLSLLWMFQSFVASGISAIPEGREALKQNLEIVNVLQKDCKRSFTRGVTGQVYEMLNADTNQQWVDPRTDISTPIVAVWYAEDDSCCPPAHGKWLAEVFQGKEGAQTNVRVEKKALGHLTYFVEECTHEGIQTKVLLEMLNGK